ncbi:hypothetical protein K2X40_01985 [Candidatus Babeliales bacterium]|nr:hypothetical protein [Candidatus Babeliales bacterium]
MFLLLIVLWLMPVAQPLEMRNAEPVVSAVVATSLCQEDLHELLKKVIAQCGQQGDSTVGLIATMNNVLEQQRLLVQQFDEKEPEEKEAVRIKVRLLDIVIILGIALGIYYFWEDKWYQPLLDFFNKVKAWLAELWEKLWNMLPRWSEPVSPPESHHDFSPPRTKEPKKPSIPPTESPKDVDVPPAEDLASAQDLEKDKHEKEKNEHKAYGHYEHDGRLGLGDLPSGFAGSSALTCSLDSLMQACARNNVEQELLFEFFKTVEPVAVLGQHCSNVPNNGIRVTRATRSVRQVLSSEDALHKACESNIAGEPNVNAGISLVLKFIEYTELDKKLINAVKRQLGRAENCGIDIFRLTKEKLDQYLIRLNYERPEIDCPYVLYDLVEEQLDDAREMDIEFERY